jgi:hypothetical protein
VTLLRHIVSPSRGILLLGLAAALFAFVVLLRPKPGPLVQDSSAAAPRPAVVPRRDLRVVAVPSDTAPASEAQEDEAGGHPDVPPVDAWMLASPRRAGLISPEATAGYETILAALNLSPSQLHRLEQLIVERAENASDADQLGKEHRLSADQTFLLRNEAEAAFDPEWEAVVGTANFQIVREMLRLAPQLAEIAHSVGRELAQTGTPLDAAQMLQLGQLYKAVYASDPASRPVDRSAGFDAQIGLGQADQQVLAQAAAILSSAQMEVLRETMTTAATLR